MISGLVEVDENFRMTEGATAAVAGYDASFAGDGRNLRNEVDSMPGGGGGGAGGGEGGKDGGKQI